MKPLTAAIKYENKQTYQIESYEIIKIILLKLATFNSTYNN